jgi:hypothetical protein
MGPLPALDDALLFANKAQRAEKGERLLMRMITSLVRSLGKLFGSGRSALRARLLGLAILVPAFVCMMQFSAQGPAQGQTPSFQIEPLQGATIGVGRPYFETGTIVGPGVGIKCANSSGSPDREPYTLEGVATYGDGEGGGNRHYLGINCDYGNNERVAFILSHVYAEPGTYPVSVKIADREGAIGTASATVVVEDPTAPSDTGVTKEASAGETVSTAGNAPTSDNLIISSVTTPNAGEVSINESSTVDQQPPSGYTFFGQQVNINTPNATTENPLVLKFSIDSSLVPAGTDPNSIQVFRNGALVEECTDPSTSSAQPDPCVASKESLTDGDVAVTVRTSQASAWNFGVQEDTTAPTMTTTDPQAGAKGVPRTTKVTASFSEAVQAATLTSANVQLFSGNSTKPIKATLSKTATSVTLTPSQRLDAKRRYTAKIKGGSTGVKDLAGNPLASDFSWSFTTGSK